MTKTFEINPHADAAIGRGAGPRELRRWYVNSKDDALLYYAARRPTWFPQGRPAAARCELCGSPDDPRPVAARWEASLAIQASEGLLVLVVAFLTLCSFRIISFETHHTACANCRRVLKRQLPARYTLRLVAAAMTILGPALLAIGIVEVNAAGVVGDERALFWWIAVAGAAAAFIAMAGFILAARISVPSAIRAIAAEPFELRRARTVSRSS